MSDKVEILLATYNGEKYIREQLDSILDQNYQNWVVRACDDASTDNTFEILKEYQVKYPEKFVLKKNEKGYGSAKENFLNLIKQSQCDYVMCCDQDDVWLPNKITLTLQKMKAIEEEETPILIHTDLKVVDAELNVVSESFFEHSNFRKEFVFADVLIQNFVTGCTMMMNRSLVQLVKKAECCDKILMHDWMLAILASGIGKVGFVDCPTMLYRQHSVNSVGAKKYGLALFAEKVKNAKMRQSLIDTTLQAGEIAERYQYEFPEEHYQILCAYAELWKQKKAERIRFYFRHKIFKKGLPRKVCQIIVG